MVQQQKFGVISWKILAVAVIGLSLVGCSRVIPEPEIKVVTKIEKTTIPTVARPKPVNLIDTKIYVVNKETLQVFIEEFKSVNGELAFVALSIKDYENLALNVAEMRRFINQQTQIILYYEEAVTDDGDRGNESTNSTPNGETK